MRISDPSLSLQIQSALSKTQSSLARAMERLASGRRVNSVRDDPSGLAIASGLESQMRALARGVLNINESVMQTQTLSGELDSLRSMVQRMRELALQSANGILSSSDRAALDSEFQALQTESARILSQGSWAAQNARGSYSLQVGENRDDRIQITMPSLSRNDLFAVTTEDYRGTGTYSVASTIGIGASLSQQAADYSGDGINDIAVTISSLNQVRVFVNNGSGVMSQTATITGAASSTYTTNRDFSGDGLNDILVTNGTNGTIQIYTNNGDGTFALTTNETVAAFSSVIAAYDLNDNGATDIIVNRTTSIDTYIVDDDGQATLSSSLNHGLSSASINPTKDFNGDGINDIYISATGAGARVYLNDGAGSYSYYGGFNIAANFFTSAADFNEDGLSDIYAMNLTTGVLNTYLNNGSGTFTPTATINGSASSSFYIGHINNDGRQDIVESNGSASSFNVYLDNGTGTYVLSSTVATGGYAPSGSLDLNSDGFLDLYSIGTSGLSIYLSQGSGTFTQTFSNSHGFTATGQAASTDRFYAYRTATGQAILYENIGDGVFQIAQTFNLGTAITNVAFLDLDGDDIEDFAAYSSTTFYSYHREANGQFTARPNYSISMSGFGLDSSTDYNDDDVPDLTTRDASNNITVHLQNSVLTSEIDETPLSIATQSEAEDVLDTLDDALSTLSSKSAQLGAIQSRLDFAANVSLITQENLASAKSQIVDADYAEEMAEITRYQILQSSGLSTLSVLLRNWRLNLELLSIL